MSVLPSSVSEYSTATIFDLVSRLPTNPVDSSSRRVRVSMRWEMPRRRCRSSPWRWGLPSSENKTLGVHLPIYTDPSAADSRAVMPSHLLVACLVVRSRPPRVLRPHGGANSSVPITGRLESLRLASATSGGARGASGGEQPCSWLRRRRRDWQAIRARGSKGSATGGAPALLPKWPRQPCSSPRTEGVGSREPLRT